MRQSVTFKRKRTEKEKGKEQEKQSLLINQSIEEKPIYIH